ncbi:hypothetical protein B0T16DRAFT_457067 [Cercophora newfieldiana]|uniref:Uncharacterized protein n=1 Tax=Cercophora newfieldiana TaxID=92897 RepID=A0AA39YDT5_9PEZI|nr:hypothetical protein B0T16DRAFT_457067 [Cercophora newfieldiana]
MADSDHPVDARFWSRSGSGTHDPLGPGGIGAKLPYVKSALERATSSSPSFFVFSVCGDPFRGSHTVSTMRQRPTVPVIAEIAPLEAFLGLNDHSHGLFDTLRTYLDYFTDFDPSQQHREAITFLVRSGRSGHAVIFALKVYLRSFSAVALLAAKNPADLAALRALISDANAPLLRASPLGLLALVLEQRSLIWEEWVAKVWVSINMIEGMNKLAPEAWISCFPSEEKLKELEDMDALQNRMSEAGVELSHGTGILEGGVRLGKFFEEAITVVYGEEQTQGGLMCGGLRPGEREHLMERLRGPMSRIVAALERFRELHRRHQGHIGQIHNLIAQRETKTNRAIAEINLDVARVTADDSRTMKTVALVELIFLPAIFISTLWGAVGIVELDGATNKHVFVAVILTLTATVLCCWALYMRFSRKPFDKRHNSALAAGLGIV